MVNSTLNGFLLIGHVPSSVNCSAGELAIVNRSRARVTRKRHVSLILQFPRQGTRVEVTTHNRCLVLWEMFYQVLNSVSLCPCIEQYVMKCCFVMSYFVTVLVQTITLHWILTMFFPSYSNSRDQRLAMYLVCRSALNTKPCHCPRE